jgi:hypothetical protein
MSKVKVAECGSCRAVYGCEGYSRDECLYCDVYDRYVKKDDEQCHAGRAYINCKR